LGTDKIGVFKLKMGGERGLDPRDIEILRSAGLILLWEGEYEQGKLKRRFLYSNRREKDV